MANDLNIDRWMENDLQIKSASLTAITACGNTQSSYRLHGLKTCDISRTLILSHFTANDAILKGKIFMFSGCSREPNEFDIKRSKSMEFPPDQHCTNMNETYIKWYHALTKLHKSFRAQHVDRHRKLQFLVEFDGGRRVKHHRDHPAEECLIGFWYSQLFGGNIAVDRNDFVQVIGSFLAKLVEKRSVENFAESKVDLLSALWSHEKEYIFDARTRPQKLLDQHFAHESSAAGDEDAAAVVELWHGDVVVEGFLAALECVCCVWCHCDCFVSNYCLIWHRVAWVSSIS